MRNTFNLGHSLRRVGSRALLVAAVAALPVIALACAKAAPTPTPTATPRPAPTATPLPALTATPTATPRPQPTPTATAAPTPTPTPAPIVRLAANATPWVGEGYDGLSKPKRGGTLRMSWNNMGPSYDVQQEGTASWASFQHGPKYDNLVRHYEPAPGTKIVADLAQSWDISADGKVYTFKLRSGVKWHDGTPFTSADVVATYQRIAKPPKGVISTGSDWFADVVSMEAPDDLTVKITLTTAVPYFLDFLAHAQMGINQKKFLEANNFSLRTTPDYPGTGPFRFKETRENASWTLERNPNYWNGELPFLDSFEYYKLDTSAAATAMVAGRLDEVRVSDNAAYGIMQKDTTILLLPRPGMFSYFFWTNRNVKPFDDVRVRQALNMVWDRNVLFETGKQFRIEDRGDGFVPFGSGWEKEMVGDSWKTRSGLRGITDADVQEARRLMKDAGYENGLGDVDVAIRGALSPIVMFAAQTFQASIDKYLTGKTVFKYRPTDFAAAKGMIRNNDYVAFSLASNFGEVDHPVIWLKSYWHSKGGNRLANYNNPEFDSLVDQLLNTLDRKQQAELGKKALDLLYRDLPAIPTGVWGTNQDAIKDYLKGSGVKTGTNNGFSAFRRDTTFLDK